MIGLPGSRQVLTVLVLAIDQKDALAAVESSPASGPWNYVPVTPLSLHRALGVTAGELIVTDTMRSSPELMALVKAVTPCFTITGGIRAALERAEVPIP